MMRRALGLLVLTLASRAGAAVFSCDEAGVLAAIAAGGGPHTFSCPGPTTVVTSAELVISQSADLDGGGLLALSGGNAHRVIRIPSSALAVDVSLRNLILRDGLAPEVASFREDGGCIRTSKDLTLENVEIYGCEGRSGGAIYTEFGSLTAIDSSIHGNRGGGAIYRATDGYSSTDTLTRVQIRDNVGGGINTGASATITDSTIMGNTADTDAGISVGGLGEGTVVISRSTIAYNAASSRDGSGGLGVHSFAEVDDSTFVGNLPVAIRGYQWGPPIQVESVTVRSSTLIGNAGRSTIVVDPGPPPNPHVKPVFAGVDNTIVAGGTFGDVLFRNGNLYVPANPAECDGWPPASSLRCATKDQIHMGKLGPHGGPTWTVPLIAPSAAIDAAPGCMSSTDQRGVARPQGAACDVGAFEWDGPGPGVVPALPPLGVALLLAALLVSGARARRTYRVRASALSALAFVALHAPTARAAVFPCSEAGILAAVAAGGGPHTFACAGPTTVVVSGPIAIAGSVILDGQGQLTVSGGHATQVFGVSGISTPETIELRGFTVRDGTSIAGGCIGNGEILKLVDTTVTGCSADYAGGIFTTWELRLERSHVSDNMASFVAGGIYNDGRLFVTDSVVSGNSANQVGGGIVGNGQTTITDSMVSGNTAPTAGGVYFGGTLAGPNFIIRSTISGNTATDAALGGAGIVNQSEGMFVWDSTVAANTNGGIKNFTSPYTSEGAYIEVLRSTIAGNSGPTPTAIFSADYPPNFANERIGNTILAGTCNPMSRSSPAPNVESPGNSCGLSTLLNQVNVPAAALNLGKLGPHGGPTATIPLRSPSVAIDAAASCSSATDQRGVARPQGSACDVGAYEWDGDAPVPALPRIGVVALIVALAVAGAWALRRRGGA